MNPTTNQPDHNPTNSRRAHLFAINGPEALVASGPPPLTSTSARCSEGAPHLGEPPWKVD